ncbi:MAG: BACON domain-containing protein [Pyrinomonadaceae bacterium]
MPKRIGKQSHRQKLSQSLLDKIAQIRRWSYQVLPRLRTKRAQTLVMILAILLASSAIVLVAYTARLIDSSASSTASQAADLQSATRLKEYVYGGGRLISTDEKSCVATISPVSQNISDIGGGGSIDVSVSQGCSWNAVSDVSWIRITPEAVRVSYTVEANGGPQRSGTISINGQAFTIIQAPSPASCGFSLNISNQSFSEFASGGAFSVSAGAGCGWSATSNADWISVTSGSSGNGGGTVGFSIAGNGGPQRSGAITVGGQVFTVTQAPNQGSCGFSANPGSQSFGSAGGGGSFTVGTGAGCIWDTAPDGGSAGWITITGGGTGVSNGTVSFSVGVNNGPQRSGTIFVRGQPVFTVTQASAPCTYSLSPTSAFFDSKGGGGGIKVTTLPGCPWTASASSVTGGNVIWLRVSPASRTGSGVVGYTVDGNGGRSSRSGQITIGGQKFTVGQDFGRAPIGGSPL